MDVVVFTRCRQPNNQSNFNMAKTRFNG